nr:origin recognition complex subunit 2-like [Salvelinus alpinus]
MLRGEKTQNALGQLASLPNLHLVASIDHINAPLVWDQCKLSRFNWLWWECVCFQRYVEETSYENSLLVQQTGSPRPLLLDNTSYAALRLTPGASLNCWWSSNWRTRTTLHTQACHSGLLPALSGGLPGEL